VRGLARADRLHFRRLRCAQTKLRSSFRGRRLRRISTTRTARSLALCLCLLERYQLGLARDGNAWGKEFNHPLIPTPKYKRAKKQPLGCAAVFLMSKLERQSACKTLLADDKVKRAFLAKLLSLKPERNGGSVCGKPDTSNQTSQQSQSQPS
jgi:hypothetical protein